MTHSAIIVDADLTIRAGTAEAHLSGSGPRLTFETARLTPFLASLPDDSRRGIQPAATRLAAMGLTIGVIEDGVAVLEIGNVGSSFIGRAFGLRDIRIHRPLRLLMRYLRR